MSESEHLILYTKRVTIFCVPYWSHILGGPILNGGKRLEHMSE